MTLPTSIEFTSALNHFADVLAAKLELPVERITATLQTLEASESLEATYEAWLQHDDQIDFEDDDYDDLSDWEPGERDGPIDSDDYNGPSYDDQDEHDQW